MKRKTSKFMFGVMGAMILGGAVTMQVFARSEAKPATDLMFANVEAMAEEEQGAKNADHYETNDSEGVPYKINGRTCVDFKSEVNCIGNGFEFCINEKHQWTECFD